MNDLRGRIILAATAGLAVIAIMSILVITPASMTAQPAFSDWGPAQLVPGINSTANDAGPALSKNGLSLYFDSNRGGGLGGSDIWVSQRKSTDEPWGPPINVGPVNSTATDAAPNLSRDGHWLFFMSMRPGSLLTNGVPGFDIWVSYRDHVHDDFDWQLPVRLEGPVNSSGFDQNPFFLDNEEIGVPQLFFGKTIPNQNEIYVSNRLPDGSFGPPEPVVELNTTANERGISIRFDGLEVVIMSNRAGGRGLQDLWTANRESVLDPWPIPANLGALVNSTAGDFDPHLSSDRETLYFMSNRTGGIGGQDLYVTTRIKLRGKP
jgi:hypothetical protein